MRAMTHLPGKSPAPLRVFRPNGLTDQFPFIPRSKYAETHTHPHISVSHRVAGSGADSIGHVPPLLQMAGHWGVEEQQKRNWPKTVLTITKALTKTTNRTFIGLQPKKWRGSTKIFSGTLRQISAPPTLSNSSTAPLIAGDFHHSH